MSMPLPHTTFPYRGMRFQWTRETVQSLHNVIAAYRVGGGEQRLFQRKSSLSVLSGFSPNTEYEIMIVAVNEIGLGPSTCPMQYVTTMEDSK